MTGKKTIFDKQLRIIEKYGLPSLAEQKPQLVTFPPSHVYHLAGVYASYTFCGQWFKDEDNPFRVAVFLKQAPGHLRLCKRCQTHLKQEQPA